MIFWDTFGNTFFFIISAIILNNDQWHHFLCRFILYRLFLFFTSFLLLLAFSGGYLVLVTGCETYLGYKQDESCCGNYNKNQDSPTYRQELEV
jgi:hypothetical protein